ncbi:LLM class flavin-dependent oxidoreductase [Sphingomonas profundi]|uniref:LLM class flavin-dependent oxidoreductase n=1 Tax=Alterirhizorhabdus profundi TaxID=2681549 RepID=UPI0012E850A7|nr:LLM class flavin-dependent oxidoreductase [Sphingomonas profundi]
MTVRIYWQLDVAAEPARGEPSLRGRLGHLARDVRTASQNRFDYYAQVARAAAQAGFDGLFLPHRADADDSQIVAAAIAREAPRLLLIPQFPASVGSAVYAAKQAVSFQRATRNRLAWAIAPDADAATRARAADHAPENALADRIVEFLTVARGVHGGRPFSFAGSHFEVQGGGFDAPLNRVPFPAVFFEGASKAALDLSARSADVHIFRDTPLGSLSTSVAALGERAHAHGRHVAPGIAQQVIARETA